MKSCLSKDFKYTPAKEQGPDYLKNKFERIRKQQKKEAEAKVQQFPQRRKA